MLQMESSRYAKRKNTLKFQFLLSIITSIRVSGGEMRESRIEKSFRTMSQTLSFKIVFRENIHIVLL